MLASSHIRALRLLATLTVLAAVAVWTIHSVTSVNDAALHLRNLRMDYDTRSARIDFVQLDASVAELNRLLIQSLLGVLVWSTLCAYVARRWLLARLVQGARHVASRCTVWRGASPNDIDASLNQHA